MKNHLINGATITALLICFLSVLAYLGGDINPAPLLVIAVVLSRYQGSVTEGLVSSVMGMLYSVWWFADPHTLVSYQPTNLISLFLILIGLPIITLLVSSLQIIGKQVQRKIEVVGKPIVDSISKKIIQTNGNHEERLQTQLSNALEFAARDRSRVAVMSIEIDNIDKINELYGSDVGLEAIDVSLHRLLNSTRRNDFAERIDQHKFIIFLVGIRSEIAIAESARRILGTLGEAMMLPHILDEVTIHANAGIASYPTDGSDAKELIEAANLALEKAKNSGQTNQVVLHNQEIVQTSELRLGD